STNGCPSPIGLQQRGEDPNGGCFSCPVGAEDAQHGARPCREGGAGQRGSLPQPPDQSLCQGFVCHAPTPSLFSRLEDRPGGTIRSLNDRRPHCRSLLKATISHPLELPTIVAHAAIRRVGLPTRRSRKARAMRTVH